MNTQHTPNSVKKIRAALGSTPRETGEIIGRIGNDLVDSGVLGPISGKFSYKCLCLWSDEAAKRLDLCKKKLNEIRKLEAIA